jgi:hypothetical protein
VLIRRSTLINAAEVVSRPFITHTMAATARIVLGLGTAAVAQSLLRKLLKRWTNRKNFGGLESEPFCICM